MKNLLRRWLRITSLEEDQSLTKFNLTVKVNDLEKRFAQQQDRYAELERENRIAYGIVNGLLDYLGVDYKKKLTPDLRFYPEPPEPQRMMEIIVIEKKPKKPTP